MEAPSSNANLCFPGLTQQPQKKLASERCDPRQEGHNLKTPDLNLSEIPTNHIGKQPKTEPKNGCVVQEVSLAATKADNKPEIMDLNKGAQRHPPPSFPALRLPIVCKFCGQQFATTQALGGHQNAHKQERQIQRAMRAALELSRNPFISYSLPRTARPRAPLLQGSHYGPQFRYSPYFGYALSGCHPTMGLLQGRSSPTRPVRLTVPPSSVISSYDSGWLRPPHVIHALHPTGSYISTEHDLPAKQKTSSELDLTLKL